MGAYNKQTTSQQNLLWRGASNAFSYTSNINILIFCVLIYFFFFLCFDIVGALPLSPLCAFDVWRATSAKSKGGAYRLDGKRNSGNGAAFNALSQCLLNVCSRLCYSLSYNWIEFMLPRQKNMEDGKKWKC